MLTAGPHISGYKVRGVVFIIGSILAFAASIRPLGLVIASFATMVICAAAAEDTKWGETLIVAVVVTAGCAICGLSFEIMKMAAPSLRVPERSRMRRCVAASLTLARR